jgi:hypothetical protein
VLEPCNAKVLRTVLRGLGVSNDARLLDHVRWPSDQIDYGPVIFAALNVVKRQINQLATLVIFFSSYR